jgi:D-alanyl-D-alanine carboxypeptidase
MMLDGAVASDALGKGTHYGFGLLIVDRPELGRYIGHSGWYPGYASNAACFVDHGFCVAIQMNRDDRVDIHTPLRSVAADVMEAMRKKPRIPRP